MRERPKYQIIEELKSALINEFAIPNSQLPTSCINEDSFCFPNDTGFSRIVAKLLETTSQTFFADKISIGLVIGNGRPVTYASLSYLDLLIAVDIDPYVIAWVLHTNKAMQETADFKKNTVGIEQLENVFIDKLFEMENKQRLQELIKKYSQYKLKYQGYDPFSSMENFDSSCAILNQGKILALKVDVFSHHQMKKLGEILKTNNAIITLYNCTNVYDYVSSHSGRIGAVNLLNFLPFSLDANIVASFVDTEGKQSDDIVPAYLFKDRSGSVNSFQKSVASHFTMKAALQNLNQQLSIQQFLFTFFWKNRNLNSKAREAFDQNFGMIQISKV